MNRQVPGGRVASALCSGFRRRAGRLAGLLAVAIPAPLAAGLIPAPIAAPPVIPATPALWEVRDADTTIYLFGTFHSLDARTVWFNDGIRSAFDRSGELVLETVVPTDRAALRAAGNAQATDVSPDGGPPRLKPFIAQTQAVADQGKSIGLTVAHGADAVLRRVAEGAGKPVAGLEGFEEQLGALARIPVAAAPAVAIATPASPPVTMVQLLDAWKVGDMAAFSTMLSGFESKSPVAYRLLITDRNARWGQWIANRLDRPGTVFVAVGSGHLAGKDSVQQWLSMRGIGASRII